MTSSPAARPRCTSPSAGAAAAMLALLSSWPRRTLGQGARRPAAPPAPSRHARGLAHAPQRKHRPPRASARPSTTTPSTPNEEKKKAGKQNQPRPRRDRHDAAAGELRRRRQPDPRKRWLLLLRGRLRTGLRGRLRTGPSSKGSGPGLPDGGKARRRIQRSELRRRQRPGERQRRLLLRRRIRTGMRRRIDADRLQRLDAPLPSLRRPAVAPRRPGKTSNPRGPARCSRAPRSSAPCRRQPRAIQDDLRGREGQRRRGRQAPRSPPSERRSRERPGRCRATVTCALKRRRSGCQSIAPASARRDRPVQARQLAVAIVDGERQRARASRRQPQRGAERQLAARAPRSRPAPRRSARSPRPGGCRGSTASDASSRAPAGARRRPPRSPGGAPIAATACRAHAASCSRTAAGGSTATNSRAVARRDIAGRC